MLPSDSELDRLSEQLPLQSDMDDIGNKNNKADDPNSNVDDNRVKISKSLDLMNDNDDTNDTDFDVQKPIHNDAHSASNLGNPWYYKPANWIKLNLVFFLLSLLIAGIAQPKLLWKLMQIFLQWMEANLVSGSFALIGIYIICDLMMMPCLVFSLGAGFVYCNVLDSMFKGLLIATSLVFVAEFIGSTIAFLAARYLLRKSIKKIAVRYPKFGLIDAAVKKKGFKVVLLFRMSPVTPYNLFNYFMGLTSVRLIDYSSASIGIIPNFFICCLIGGSLHHIYQLSQIKLSDNIGLLCITIFGIIFAIFGVIYGTKMIKKELAKISIQLKQEKDILSSEDQPLTNIEVDELDDHKQYNYDHHDILSLDDISNIELLSNVEFQLHSAADPNI